MVEAERLKGGFNPIRKAWHLLGLLVPLFLYIDLFSMFEPYITHATRVIGVIFLSFLCLATLAVDLLRLHNDRINHLFYRMVGSLMKKEELHRINGTVPYLLANVVLIAFFQEEVVVIGCVLLMIGDPAAAFFGSRYGRLRFSSGKSLEGLLAFIFAGFLASIIFLGFHTWHSAPGDTLVIYGDQGILLLPLLISFCGAIVAAISEFYSVPYWHGLIDDNLIVPLVGATGIALAGLMLGFPAEAFFFDPRLIFTGQ